MDPTRIPVIAAIGEFKDEPDAIIDALEPLDAMAIAARRADNEAGASLLATTDSVDVVNFISWPYADPASQLCERLGISPQRRVYGAVGGETPLRLVYEAARRICAGDSQVALVCGGEAHQAVARAERDGLTLPWTAKPAVAAPSVRSQDLAHPLAKRLGAHLPVSVYPLYETATAARRGQTPAEAAAESASMWSRMSAIAMQNATAWIRRPHTPMEIATPSPTNRFIAEPYTKLMVANIAVNQAAAVIVTSLAKAREAGIDDGRLVFIGAGFHAQEPQDYLLRDAYSHCVARDAVLEAAKAERHGLLDAVELYSCFPVVPKSARRALDMDTSADVTVTGGLTFFGAPLNNYMTHALCAMTRRLRHKPGTGLLYGQGGYMTKHMSLVLGSSPAVSVCFQTRAASVQDAVSERYGPIPPFKAEPIGRARVEAHTVLHSRDGARTGVVVVRTEDGARSLAGIPAEDSDTLSLLGRHDAFAIDAWGDVTVEPNGAPRWRAV
jgi:acetyl-CoA C-acetyltransferase